MSKAPDAQRAFEMWKNNPNTPWTTIAEACGYRRSYTAKAAVKRIAELHGMEVSARTSPDPDRAALAYRLGLEGVPWDLVAKQTGYKTASTARTSAQRHWRTNGLPPVVRRLYSGRDVASGPLFEVRTWLSVEWRSVIAELAEEQSVSQEHWLREAIVAAASGGTRTSRNVLSPAQRAAEAYRLRATGHRWEEAAHTLGYSGERSCSLAAKRHAEASGRAWPIPLDDS